MRQMKIRKQLVTYFSATTICLVGIAMWFIYTLFADYRLEEYRDRLRDKIVITLKFLAEVEQLDHDILQQIDKFSINNLYTENLLLFDSNKKLIYSGIDDTKIVFASQVLNQLNRKNPLVETREQDFDVVGAYVVYNNKAFYGITKAYDRFGYKKLNYLKYVLLFVFIGISIVILVVSNYLAKKIAQPLDAMAKEIGSLNFGQLKTRVTIPESNEEISYLATKFNELMESLERSFSFQKHAIHHISHELKTPIAILVSNFDRIEREEDPENRKDLIRIQKEDTKSLGDIINAMLEIAKVESGNHLPSEKFRIDEVIFDCLDDAKNINSSFNFTIHIDENIELESQLTVSGYRQLFRSAVLNLMVNCIKYAAEPMATIEINIVGDRIHLIFSNSGDIISDQERPFLFQYFFRGGNSKGKHGFGLGLVLIERIIHLHKGQVSYSAVSPSTNIFTLSLTIHKE